MKTLEILKKHIIKFLKNLDDIIDRIKNSLKFNGFYIILSLLFPLLLAALGAGEEIFHLLLNKDQFYNNILIDIAFFMLAYSLWIIPALSIYFFRSNIFGEKVPENCEEKAFTKLTKIYNGQETSRYSNKQIAVRYLATLPFLIFILVLIYTNANAALQEYGKDFTASALQYSRFALVIFTFLVLPYLFYLLAGFLAARFHKNKNIAKKLLLIYVATVLLYIITFQWPPIDAPIKTYFTYFYVKILDINPVLLIISHSFAFLFIYFSLRAEELNAVGFSEKQKYAAGKKKHLFFLVFPLIVVGIFAYLNHHGFLGVLSPIVVGIFLIALLIMFIECFYTAPKLLMNLYAPEEHNDLKRIGLKFLLLFLVGL